MYKNKTGKKGLSTRRRLVALHSDASRASEEGGASPQWALHTSFCIARHRPASSLPSPTVNAA